MKWERVELGTLVEKVKKCLPEKETPNTNIKYVDISSIDRISKSVDRHSIQSILGTEAPSRARQVLKPDDILVSTVRPNLNAVAAIPDSLDGSIGSTGFSVLRPLHGKLLSKYLLYFVQSEYFINQLMQRATGASYPAVSDKIVKETQIPLPPLSEQRRLAARLDKADAVRQKSRALVDAYAELGRSVFLEVFGDPVRNERGWEVVELGEISEVVTGNTPPRSNKEYYGDFIEWVKTDNINTPHMYLTAAKEFLSSKGATKGRIASKNSILVTCIAGSPQVIGNAAIASRDVAFNQQINAMTAIQGNTAFFYYQLLVSKQLIQSFSTNSMKGMISKSKFKKIPLINPPLPLQTRFAAMVANIEAQRRLAERQLEAAEAVFGGVLQGTFER
ncbi:restriction endonuclease subunit S [Phaeodactylibacter xiamenensis]|uniref:restriction endonuclease subunit S n=1 Tax=Phaeodactylibacter xiamenensis TaxID=1524460 RepID=UPI0024A8C302|nr:restriction endonuclease subunit S [Phaeodactylibacter xiamenensis]